MQHSDILVEVFLSSLFFPLFILFSSLFDYGSFSIFVSVLYLRRRRNSRRHRLDVVTVEEALEVEVRQLLLDRDREELTERGIRLDVVLVLQVLLLDIVVHALRDLRAAHQRAIRLAEELAQLIRHLHGALEDGRGALDLDAIDSLDLRAALALARILDLAVHALLELLDLRHHGRRRLAERREVLHHRLEVLIERRRRADNRRSGRLLNRRRGDNNRRRRRSRNRSRGRRRGLLGLRRLRLNRRGNNGRGRDNRRGNLLLLRYLLLGNSLGGGGTHRNTCGGGRRRGHFTRYTIMVGKRAVNFQFGPGIFFL